MSTVRRVYDALRGEGGFGTASCGVKYLADLAQDVEWTQADPEALPLKPEGNFGAYFTISPKHLPQTLTIGPKHLQNTFLKVLRATLGVCGYTVT